MHGVEAQFVAGPCRLLLGDARVIVPQLTDKARLLLTDPPYRLTSGGRGGEMGGAFDSDYYDNSGELFDMVEWHEMGPLFWDVLRDDADAIVMTSDREEGTARQALQAAGFRFHRLLIWDKVTATPNRWYMPNCEFGLYLFKGRARQINDCGSKALIRFPHRDVSHRYLPDGIKDDRPHQTEKPVPVMQHWIENSTHSGDLVIDPFMGSGSTIVAAALSDRRAIGIERDRKWFDVACRRVAEAVERAEIERDLFLPLVGVQEVLAL